MDPRPRGKKDDQNVVESQDNDNATASKFSISPHISDDSSRLLLSAASQDMLAILLREIQDGNKGLSMKIDKKSAELHSSIADLKSSMNDLLLRTTEAEMRISTVEDTVARHDQVLIELQKDNAYLKNKVDQMENQSRRSNIRVVGLKEDSEGRDPVRFFTQWIPDVLGIINFTKLLEIERAHRTSAPKPRPEEPPRAILVRFLCFQDREKILQLARAKSQRGHHHRWQEGQPFPGYECRSRQTSQAVQTCRQSTEGEEHHRLPHPPCADESSVQRPMPYLQHTGRSVHFSQRTKPRLKNGFSGG